MGTIPSTTVPLTVQVLKLSMRIVRGLPRYTARRRLSESLERVAVYFSTQARSASYLTLV
jgi:hypothetical protein